MIAKRTNVAKEILSTEKQYVQNLRNLVAVRLCSTAAWRTLLTVDSCVGLPAAATGERKIRCASDHGREPQGAQGFRTSFLTRCAQGVFSDIEVILGYHSLLEKELEKRISAWSQSVKLGDIFLKIVRSFFALRRSPRCAGIVSEDVQSVHPAL